MACGGLPQTPGGQHMLSVEVSAMRPGIARSHFGLGYLTKHKRSLCYHSPWWVCKHSVCGGKRQRFTKREGWRPADRGMEETITAERWTRWMAATERYSESRAHTHMAIAGGRHGGGSRAPPT